MIAWRMLQQEADPERLACVDLTHLTQHSDGEWIFFRGLRPQAAKEAENPSDGDHALTYARVMLDFVSVGTFTSRVAAQFPLDGCRRTK